MKLVRPYLDLLDKVYPKGYDQNIFELNSVQKVFVIGHTRVAKTC
jgi:hypothetical protein